MISSRSDCLNPVLVGGTGRSGSTITGRLLGQHPALALTKPEEVRFIANEHGMAHALAMKQGSWPRRMRAQSEAELALKRTKTIHFWRTKTTGLHTSISKEELDELGQKYLADFRRKPVDATQEFTYAVMAKVTESASGRRWVDGTPANARFTDLIEPIYAECQVIAIIRDGRDVAASFIEQKFGPNEIFESLQQWETRTFLMQNAVNKCKPGRILTIDMIDLVQYDRDNTLTRICDFLGINVDPGMKAWFDENVTAEGAHLGRWRSQFDAETTVRIDATYAQMVERLTAAGARVPLPSP
jgi:hypothetical protein